MTFVVYDSAQKAVLHTFPTWLEAEAARVEADVKTAWVVELEPLFEAVEEKLGKKPQEVVSVAPAAPVTPPVEEPAPAA